MALRLIAIFLTLFGYWLLLSGVYLPWLVMSGAITAILVIWFSVRKGVTDEEGFPVEKLPRTLLYLPWLVWQIVLSALNVTRIVLDPRLPISPTLTRVDAKAKSAVGLTAYANSITLTPGTISVEVSERRRQVWVHAITRENATSLQDDPMNAYVGWLDGQDGESGEVR